MHPYCVNTLYTWLTKTMPNMSILFMISANKKETDCNLCIEVKSLGFKSLQKNPTGFKPCQFYLFGYHKAVTSLPLLY